MDISSLFAGGSGGGGGGNSPSSAATATGGNDFGNDVLGGENPLIVLAFVAVGLMAFLILLVVIKK